MASLNVNKAEFIKSAADPRQFIRSSVPTVAFAGKSNVGKSSVINRLLGRKNFARVGAQPGKTIHVNYFKIDDKLYLVDLPGYGYAKMPQKEREKLQEVIRNYLNFSEELRLIFVLIDCRHDVQKVDLDFMNELVDNEIPFAIIFTKGDKLGPVARQKQIDSYKNQLLQEWAGLPECLVSSAETGLGKDEILGTIEQLLATE